MRLAAFDLDGTLVDTLPDLHASVNFSLEQLGFPLLSESQVASFLGHGARELCLDVLPDGSESSARELMSELKRIDGELHSMKQRFRSDY